MADRYCSFSIEPKILEFAPGKIICVYQHNFDAGSPIEVGDNLKIPKYPSNYVTLNKYLVNCGVTIRDDAVGAVAPNGFPPPSGYVDGYSATVGNRTFKIYRNVSLHIRNYSSVSLRLQKTSDNTDTYYLYCQSADISLTSDKVWLSCASIFYDVQGGKYITPGSSGTNLAATSRDTQNNELGLIKTNTMPQFIPPSLENIGYEHEYTFRNIQYDADVDALFQNIVLNYDGYRPYDNIPVAEPEEGPGTADWDLPTDLVTEGGSPYSDLEAGLYRVYAMTATQVFSFSDQLWNANILDIISRYFERPQDVVISLKSFPFDVAHGTDENIEFRWISQWSSVNVTGGPVTQEMQVIDFGSKYVPRYSGLFFDYQPYSSLQLHLPYIGFVPLKMNEVIGRTLRVKYYVNVVSGDFTAHVMTDGNPLKNIGYYQGAIARELPLSSDDMFALVKKGAEIAAGAIMATGYGVAGAVESAAAQRIGGDIVQEVSNGNPQATESTQFAMAVTHEEKADHYTKEFKRHASHAIGNALQSIGSVNAPIARSGNLDGMNGRTSSQEVFYIMSVPHPNVPSNQQILGYPANLAGPLKNYTGYTTVREIRLSSAIATSSELAELEGILRGGIVI